MAKNKVKPTQPQKQQSIITQYQRNNNPIFKVIYNRIRNLTKKLNDIKQLMSRDQSTLKPQQIRKIQNFAQVQGQIKKNQQFAQFYKVILDQCGGIDNSQDIIKIATLIAVGQCIEKQKNQINDDIEIKDTHDKSYRKILHYEHKKQRLLIDRVGDIYQALVGYIKDPNQYNALQKYIEFMKPENQSQQAKQQIKSENKQVKTQVKSTKKNKDQPKQEQKKQDTKKIQTTNTKQSQKYEDARPVKQEKLEVTDNDHNVTEKVQIVTMKPNKEVVVTQGNQKVEKVQKVQKVEKVQKPEKKQHKIQTHTKQEVPKSTQTQKQPEKQPQKPAQKHTQKYTQKHTQKHTQKPAQKPSKKEEQDDWTKQQKPSSTQQPQTSQPQTQTSQQPQQQRRTNNYSNRRYNNTRPYNNQNRNYNHNYNNNNNNQSRPYYQNRNKNQNGYYNDRKRNGNHKDDDQGRRSDTSLEATPDSKPHKPRFIEKR